jgi:hypothetical protein
MDLSEFTKLAGPRHRRKPCSVGAALASLPEEKSAKLAKALAAEEVLPGMIVKWLKLAGVESSTTAVGYHREAKCACHE